MLQLTGTFALILTSSPLDLLHSALGLSISTIGSASIADTNEDPKPAEDTSTVAVTMPKLTDNEPRKQEAYEDKVEITAFNELTDLRWIKLSHVINISTINYLAMFVIGKTNAMEHRLSLIFSNVKHSVFE